jgi:hypothetical protein
MPSTEPQRRFGRFSLGELFAVFALVCLGLGFSGWLDPRRVAPYLVCATLVVVLAHAFRPETGWARLIFDVGVVVFLILQFVVICCLPAIH